LPQQDKAKEYLVTQDIRLAISQHCKMCASDTAANLQFGALHTVKPQSTHTHTAIVLHGRGSNGHEFAQDFFSSHLSDGTCLAEKLPGWHWVFPSSPEIWSTTFQESIPAWFEAHSLTDITARQDLQTSGLRASIQYIQGVLEEEISKLGGNADNVLMGGISQGATIGIWTLLCPGPGRRIGGFFGSNTWLPFAENLERLLGLPANAGEADVLVSSETEGSELDGFVGSLLADWRRSRQESQSLGKVFLGHGSDDAYVDIALGQQARDVLSKAGFAVEWRVYSGAEEEGHWFKVPDQMDDMYRFIVDNVLVRGK
jgi:predicted esterase